MKPPKYIMAALLAGLALANVCHADDRDHHVEAARPAAASIPQMGAARTSPVRPEARVTQAPAPRLVDRINHGSVAHADTYARPALESFAPLAAAEEPRPAATNHYPADHGGNRQVVWQSKPPQDIETHQDPHADFAREHFWEGFVAGRRFLSLPLGFTLIAFNGSNYYYYEGVYYQPTPQGYEEIYPPIGATVPQLPEGAVAVQADDQVYYYAGGAFYFQTPAGFQVAAPPFGVTVPEPPPGAVVTVVNGQVVYNFNGVGYEPVFENGVTAYLTVPL